MKGRERKGRRESEGREVRRRGKENGGEEKVCFICFGGWTPLDLTTCTIATNPPHCQTFV